MSDFNTPCKDCTERYPGCHDKCEKYKKLRESIDKKKQNKINYRLKRGYRVDKYDY